MTIREDKLKCKYVKRTGFSNNATKCSYIAVTEGGYCKIHDPALRKERELVKRQEYNEEVAARVRVSQDRRDKQAEIERKAAGYEKALGKIMHYPECWDTTAYPTLDSALVEVIEYRVSTCVRCGP